MEKELKENLINTLREGSQKKLRKVKKEELIDLFNEVWDDESRARAELKSEIESLNTTIANLKSSIENQKDLSSTIDEYSELVQEIRGKYESALDETLTYKNTLPKLYIRIKTLKYIIYSLIGLELITILILFAI